MISPAAVVGVFACGSIVCGVLISSLTVATSGPILAAIIAMEWRRRQRAEDLRRGERSVLQTVDQMIGGLRSGLSLRQACVDQRSGFDDRLDRENPMAPLIRELGGGATLGQAATQSTTVVAEGRGKGPARDSAQLVAVTLAVLAGNGGPALPALQRLRHTLAGAEHGRRRADAESAQASASAGLLIAAPALFASAVAGIDPAAAHLYLYETIGAICVLTAMVLSWCGWWWMQRAIHRALQGLR